jgi:hypothetical protein
MTVPLAGRGPEVAAVYTLFTTLTTITMVLRVYCRICLVKKFGWDDWTATAAWVSVTGDLDGAALTHSQAIFMAHASCAFLGMRHGTGQHIANIHPPSEVPIALMVSGLT